MRSIAYYMPKYKFLKIKIANIKNRNEFISEKSPIEINSPLYRNEKD